MICERLLRDQEAALRAEYELVLNNKLSEQYEAFVRFNIDQVLYYYCISPAPCICNYLTNTTLWS